MPNNKKQIKIGPMIIIKPMAIKAVKYITAASKTTSTIKYSAQKNNIM